MLSLLVMYCRDAFDAKKQEIKDKVISPVIFSKEMIKLLEYCSSCYRTMSSTKAIRIQKLDLNECQQFGEELKKYIVSNQPLSESLNSLRPDFEFRGRYSTYNATEMYLVLENVQANAAALKTFVVNLRRVAAERVQHMYLTICKKCFPKDQWISKYPPKPRQNVTVQRNEIATDSAQVTQFLPVTITSSATSGIEPQQVSVSSESEPVSSSSTMALSTTDMNRQRQQTSAPSGIEPVSSSSRFASSKTGMDFFSSKVSNSEAITQRPSRTASNKHRNISSNDDDSAARAVQSDSSQEGNSSFVVASVTYSYLLSSFLIIFRG